MRPGWYLHDVDREYEHARQPQADGHGGEGDEMEVKYNEVGPMV